MTLNQEKSEDQLSCYSDDVPASMTFVIDEVTLDASKPNYVNNKEKNIFEKAADATMHHVGRATRAVVKDHPYSMGIPLATAAVGMSATAAGFGAAGVAAGSVAAWIQSSIGNVAAGSLFATMQSLAATGTFSAMTTGGLATATGSAAVAAVQSKNNQEENCLSHEKDTNDEINKMTGKKEEDNTQPINSEDGATSEEDSSKTAQTFDEVRKLIGSPATIYEDRGLLVIHDE